MGWVAKLWKTCIDLCANLILTKVSASHCKSTQVHGHMESQVQSRHKFSTCVYLWIHFAKALETRVYDLSVIIFYLFKEFSSQNVSTFSLSVTTIHFTAITMAYLHQHFCEKQHSTLFLYNALPPYPKHVFMT